MKRLDIHQPHDFFEYVRLDGAAVPPADPRKLDVAVLDMNHAWPNVGHDALIHALLEIAEKERERLTPAGRVVRVISFDVRRRHEIPSSPNGRFRLYLGTGGPGHLNPRENDGEKSWAQGIRENAAWEAPLFRLFDAVAASRDTALLAVCHSFGLLCRWSGAARPELRDRKSSGMPLNALSDEAAAHPWFSRFAERLPDRRHFYVVDNRLFDLVPDRIGTATPLAFESVERNVLTMVEIDREPGSGMPRIFGANHHPEIIDREHIMSVLDQKRAHGEVTEEWYRERAGTLADLFHGERERQSRLTSEFTLLGLLRHHLARLIAE
ncbi:MAG TPA: hypothetical protein VNA04_11925 [Thermoanaerobaculia bacterium]|nr:hypothetical protein [Thermoanaerobaculia bacterium]